MCNGKCRCSEIRERNETLKDEIRRLIMILDDDMNHHEFMDLKIQILSLLDEIE